MKLRRPRWTLAAAVAALVVGGLVVALASGGRAEAPVHFFIWPWDEGGKARTEGPVLVAPLGAEIPGWRFTQPLYPWEAPTVSRRPTVADWIRERLGMPVEDDSFTPVYVGRGPNGDADETEWVRIPTTLPDRWVPAAADLVGVWIVRDFGYDEDVTLEFRADGTIGRPQRPEALGGWGACDDLVFFSVDRLAVLKSMHYRAGADRLSEADVRARIAALRLGQTTRLSADRRSFRTRSGLTATRAR